MNIMQREQDSAERLRPLIDPSSIAIYGASANLMRLGGVPIALLKMHGFAGPILPINPKYSEIDGLKCFPSIESLPHPVDLIVVAVGAEEVVPVLREAARKGIRAAVIYAAGFAEAGDDEGISLQNELVGCANELGLVVAGPNCMGFGNLDNHSYSTFTAIFRNTEPPKAPRTVGLVTQSGSMCSAIYAAGRELDVKFNVVINTGNEACVEFSEYLQYLSDRPETRAIVGYVEGIRDGRRFRKVAEAMQARGQLLALLKVGDTPSGASAAKAHTGAVAGDPAIYQAGFERLGVIQGRDILHLGDIAYLAQFLRRRSIGPSAAVMTISGAVGAVLSDLFVRCGVRMAALSGEAQKTLQTGIPRYGSVQNPIDFTGSIVNSGAFVGEAVRAALQSPDVGFATFYAPGFMIDRFCESLKQAASETTKLVSIVATGEVARRLELEEAGIPVFMDLTRAAQALSSVATWTESKKRLELAESELRLHRDQALALDRLQLVQEGSEFTGERAVHLLEKLGVLDGNARLGQTGGKPFAVVLHNDPVFGLVATVQFRSGWGTETAHVVLPATKAMAECSLASAATDASKADCELVASVVEALSACFVPLERHVGMVQLDCTVIDSMWVVHDAVLKFV
ncbi:CoA-binding protein [Bradyrhizobium sp. G127]|uniref:CoA-binding protein n=1 Tax=Bradyrhizobium sp. G127 TaxID=2904800 RepID=UPI001F334D9D|nr:CoA-binding protein [Bradyrhizobium sp. G127]MCF2524880.1 CoA-binding protein [Bradyrhizobium sp. G127]